MSKIDLFIAILTGIALIGAIILLGLGKELGALLPVLTALVGALLGLKKEKIIGGLKKISFWKKNE